MHLINHSLKKGAAIAAAGALMFSLFVSGGMVMAAPPSVPVIISPVSGTSTTTSPVAIYGTAEAGMEVRVSGGLTPAGATADASGNWVALVNLNPNTTNVLEFSARNTATGEVGSSTSITITHSTVITPPDTTAPAAPVITSTSSPFTVTTSPVTLTGTAESGSVITVYVYNTSGALTGTVNATTTSGGNWTASVPLTVGANTLRITSTDAAGNVSMQTLLTVTLAGTTTADVTAPNAPVITFPTSPYTTIANSVVVTGTAEAGSTVRIVGGSVTGTTTTAVGGTWAILVPLTSGTTTTFLLTATDAAGNVSSSTSLVITQTASTTATSTATTTATTTTSTSSPIITLSGDANQTLFICNINSSGFMDPGATAVTSFGSSTPVTVSGFVNASTTGANVITYTATSNGFTATTTRTVNIIPCSSGGGGGGGSNVGGGGGGSAGSTNTNSNTGGTATSGDQNVTVFPFVGFTPVTTTGTPGTTQVLGASFVPGLPTTGEGGQAFKIFLPIMLSFGLILLGLSMSRKERTLS
jgi:large repetitive protein